MYSNVNLSAPLGALALFGTAFLMGLSVLVLLQSLIARHRGRVKIVLLTMLGVGGLYLATMLAFSFVSRDRVLPRGEEKHFCELDCHLAYSILNTATTKTFSNGTLQ